MLKLLIDFKVILPISPDIYPEAKYLFDKVPSFDTFMYMNLCGCKITLSTWEGQLWNKNPKIIDYILKTYKWEVPALILKYLQTDITLELLEVFCTYMDVNLANKEIAGNQCDYARLWHLLCSKYSYTFSPKLFCYAIEPNNEFINKTKYRSKRLSCLIECKQKVPFEIANDDDSLDIYMDFLPHTAKWFSKQYKDCAITLILCFYRYVDHFEFDILCSILNFNKKK